MLYKENAGHKHLTWKYFIAWIVLSVYHSLVVYFIGYSMWRDNNAIYSTPHSADLFSFGTFMIHTVVIIVNLKLCLIARNQTFLFLGCVFGSILLFVGSTIVYNCIFYFDAKMYYVYNNLIRSPAFWFATALAVVTSLLPDYTIMAFKMFNIKFRPLDSIESGWSCVFKRQQRKAFRRNSNVNSISESTYL